MLLVELALQGLRGFPKLSRLTLKSGLNVIKLNDQSRRLGLVDAFYHALYPDPARGSVTAALADAQASESRIALTFAGRDRVTYRVMREATTGATKLFKFDPEKNKYVLFSSSAQEVAQYVRVQQQIPDEVVMERLFIFSPDAMPSCGPSAKSMSGTPVVPSSLPPTGPGMGSGIWNVPHQRAPSVIAQPRAPSQISGILQSPMGFGSSMNMTNALVQSEIESAQMPGAYSEEPQERTVDKEALLHKLKNDLEAAARAEQAQAELDSLNMRKFELVELVERVSKLRAEVARLDQEAARFSELKELPAGFGDRLKSYEDTKAKHEVEKERLLDEERVLDQDAANYFVLPLQRDRYFIASMATALLFIALAIVFSKPALALVNILCATVAVGAAFRWVADMEGGAKIAWRIKSNKDRLERLTKQYDLDTGVMRRLMDKLNIESPGELLERLEGYEKFKAHLRSHQEAERQELSNPDVLAARQELDQIEQRVSECEAEVLGRDSTASAQTLQRRVNALERELGLPISDLSALRAMARAPSIAPPPRMGSSADLPLVRGTGDVPPRSISIVRGTADLPPRGPSVISGITPIPGPASSFAPRSSSQISGSFSQPTYPVPSVVPTDAPGSNPSYPAQPVQSSQPAQPAQPPQPPRNPRARTASAVDISDLAAPLPRSSSVAGFAPVAPGLPTPSAPSTPVAPPLPRAQSRTGSVLPAFSGPAPRPSSLPPIPAPSTLREPTPAPRPRPAPRSDSSALFDFGGGLIGEDDEDYGYGSGNSGSDGSGGQSAADEDHLPMEAIGGFSGGSGSGGGAPAGYGSGYGDEGPLPPDRSRDLMQGALDIMHVSVDQLADTVRTRMGQYLIAMTDKRFSEARFGPRGEVSVVPKDGGTPVPYTALEQEELDMVDSAIRLSLIEACVSKNRIPVLINDPFENFPKGRRRLFCQMLTYLGRMTQVVIITNKDDIPGRQVEV